ncbi:MAG: hypothetical protein ACE5DX_06020 [Candidatus Dojkabacteria bacterium]
MNVTAVKENPGTQESKALQSIISRMSVDVDRVLGVQEVFFMTRQPYTEQVGMVTDSYKYAERLIAFPIEDFIGLNAEQQQDVKQYFLEQILKIFDLERVDQLLEHWQKRFNPDSRGNILTHEAQHAEVLPDHIRKGAYFVFAPFADDRHGSPYNYVAHILSNSKALTRSEAQPLLMRCRRFLMRRKHLMMYPPLFNQA